MIPIFKMLSHLMCWPPLFRNIYRWKWPSCSHWMTPITTSWYVPNISLEGGIYVVAKRLRAHKMTPFFLQTEVFTKVLTKWPPIFLLSSLKDPIFSLFSQSPKDPTFGVVSAHPRHFHMWLSPPGHWGGVIHVHTNLENDIFLELNSITF